MALQDIECLKKCIELAQNSPPKSTNFRVGCVITNSTRVLSTGYTLELEGNTHAEECALKKLESNEQSLILYTSLEPCGKRLSGNIPCVERIINTPAIKKVIFGAKEPGTFVQDSQSCKLLTEAGIEWKYIDELEKEILEIATAGHEPRNPKKRMMEVDIL